MRVWCIFLKKNCCRAGKQAPIRPAKVAPMQSFSLGKRRKKRDGWLMTFTRLVLFVVVGLTGARWWQNHKAQQEEITTMADQSSAELNAGKEGAQNVPLDTSAAASRDTTSAAENGAVTDSAPAQQDTAAAQAPAADAQQNAVVALLRLTSILQPQRQLPRHRLPTDQAGVTTPAADPTRW